jgi:hypothetical protein
MNKILQLIDERLKNNTLTDSESLFLLILKKEIELSPKSIELKTIGNHKKCPNCELL